MKNKPRWNSVSSKMHYCITFHENGRYRVFAQAKASIRQRQWERLFDAYGVLKQFPVRGFFEEYKQAIQAEIESTPQTELEVAQNRIRELEDKIAELEGDVVRLRGKLIAHNKRKAAEMSADESEESERDEAEAEECVSVVYRSLSVTRCVFITAVPITKLFAGGGVESGGHVLRETTSRGQCDSS